MNYLTLGIHYPKPEHADDLLQATKNIAEAARRQLVQSRAYKGGATMFLKASLECSFCGKNAAEVSKLVAGPKVYICDACVAMASRIMSDSGGETPPQPSLLPTRSQRFVGRLSQLLRPFGFSASKPLFEAR